MSEDRTRDAEHTLEKKEIHEEWVDNYRTPENERFYREAFGFIAQVFDAPPGSTVLDAGCGSCAKSKNLCDQGFSVVASDLSESALQIAKDALRNTKYQSSIQLRQENVLNMSFSDGQFKYVVCWGVLMHVPEVSAAIAELCRVVAPGGRIAISEGNMNSLQSRVLRLLKRILRRERAEVIRTPAGIENWEETSEGRLMTRQADTGWLINEFASHDMRLVRHVAGQFSELYWVVNSAFLSKLIHWFNGVWFRRIRRPGPAFANILIFEKAGD